MLAASNSHEGCHREGEVVFFRCSLPDGPAAGILDWEGNVLICPSINTITDNILPLHTSFCPLPTQREGFCGPFFGNLTCLENDTVLLSLLKFVANYSVLNGGVVYCEHNDKILATFEIRIGRKFKLSNNTVLNSRSRIDYSYIH